MITPPRKEEWSYAYSLSGRHRTPVSVIIDPSHSLEVGVRILPLLCFMIYIGLVLDNARGAGPSHNLGLLPKVAAWAWGRLWNSGMPCSKVITWCKEGPSDFFCEWPRLHNENSLHIVGCYCSYREHFKKMKWYGCDIPPYSCCYAQRNFAL